MMCRVCGHRRVRCAACAAKEPVALDPLEGEWVTVPEPPEFIFPLRSHRLVLTLARGPEAQRMLRTSGPAMERYARRLGADFAVMDDWGGTPSWPMSCKFGLARALGPYDRVLYMDADVLPRRGCVDALDMAGDSDFAACDTLTHHRLCKNQVHLRFLQFCALIGVAKPLPFYLNCGVWVASAKARPLLSRPAEPIIAEHCAEEWLVNARLADGDYDWRILDRRCNWQNWTDPGFTEAPDDAILHWSAGGLLRVDRAGQMEEVARGYQTQHD